MASLYNHEKKKLMFFMQAIACYLYMLGRILGLFPVLQTMSLKNLLYPNHFFNLFSVFNK